MKIAIAFWSLGSLLVNGIIVIYVILSSKAPSDLAAKFKYINDNWDLYNPMWRVEFLLMMMIAIGAFYFAINSKKISWSIILFGQIVLLLTYPIMLGGYRNTPLEVAEIHRCCIVRYCHTSFHYHIYRINKLETGYDSWASNECGLYI